MNKQKRAFAFVLVMVVLVWGFTACMPDTARKPVPNNAENNYRNYDPSLSTPYTAQNSDNADKNRFDGQTSSLFSKLDYSFATITPSSLNIRSGPSAGSPTVANLKAGDQVKVIGKLNGWYVVNVPNTNKVGCVSPNYVKLYSAQPGTTTPEPTQPIPNVGTTTDKTGTPRTPAAGKPDTDLGGIAGTKGTTGDKLSESRNAGNAPAPTPSATGSGALSAQGSRILQLVNAERAKVGAKPLTANTELNKLATMKSQDMVEKNYFSHQSPTYGSPFDMMKKYGVSYMYAGENIAINSDADKVHNAWMNSEGHKKNILNPDFTELGIGLYPKGNGSYAYTQMFIGK